MGLAIMAVPTAASDLFALQHHGRWYFRLAASFLVAVYLAACAMTPVVRSAF